MKKIIISLLFLTSVGMFSAAEKPFISNGKSEGVIVIPANPNPVEEFAAQELQTYLRKITGVTLPVVKGKIKARTGYKLGRASGITLGKDAQPDSWRSRLKDGFLEIAGVDGPGKETDTRNPAGTLFGVYSYLQNSLGVRWLWPGELGEFIPVRKTIRVDSLNLEGAPKLRFTDLYARRSAHSGKLWHSPEAEQRYWEAQSRFLLRHRIGATVNMNYSHEFGHWWKKYGKTHPEYFALTNSGKRGPLPETPSWGTAFVDMCISNPDFHRQIITNWEKRPARTKLFRPYLGVGLNDFPIMCICPKCRAWDQKDPRFASSPYWGKGKVITFKERWAVFIIMIP